MKALQEMNNIQRALLLAQLFPENLKELIEFTQKEIIQFREKQEILENAWPQGLLITAKYWFSLIAEVDRLIKRLNVQLHRSPRIFAEHLFFGHNSIFMIHCLVRFIECENPLHELKLAIELLFGDKVILCIDYLGDNED